MTKVLAKLFIRDKTERSLCITKMNSRWNSYLNIKNKPWLVWLSGLSAWDQRVSGSSPNQGTCLGCRPGPQ